MVMSHHVGARNQTWDLYKSNKVLFTKCSLVHLEGAVQNPSPSSPGETLEVSMALVHLRQVETILEKGVYSSHREGPQKTFRKTEWLGRG